MLRSILLALLAVSCDALLLTPRVPAPRMVVINENIDKENPKRVDIITVTDLLEDKGTVKALGVGKKAVMCRCWKSGTFPLCDATHVKHNKETGDNVGPLIIDNDTK